MQKFNHYHLVISLFLLAIFACKPKLIEQNQEVIEIYALSEDVHSYTNSNDVRVTHLNLNLNVDFEKKILSGWAEWDLVNLNYKKELILDTRDLQIEKVLLDGEIETVFHLGEEEQYFGRALHIEIKETTKQVRIYYSTSPQAEALQWLNANQTLSKKHPFLYSQSQAILARTWIPCMDSPGVKFTYDATIKTDVDLMALMSAENSKEKSVDGVYRFRMSQPVSSYLMALCVGDLSFRSMGRNSGIYAEPDMLEKAVWEFESMQSMIDSAESLYGKYAWERYDVVVLPPSFPFGGMENPRLTFATPTVIAGDRSLVSLIAHELAHSWSGNLVTNETWNDFWLNEGFTVYFEQRIMEKIFGKEYEEMLTKLGMGDLEKTIKRMADNNAMEDTHLYLDLKGRNPDDGLSDVAYEKGRFFLQTIESVVGRAVFDEFLKNYFKENAFKPMNTSKFIEQLNEKLLITKELQDKVRVNDWVYGPGIPDNVPKISSSELDRVKIAIAHFKSGLAARELDTSDYTTHHWLYFLRGMDSLSLSQLKDLDNSFGFTNTGNSEIACDWFQLCIKADYQLAFPALEKFLIRVGRRKFLSPIYELLVLDPEHKKWAHEVYMKARPGYHAVSYNTIDQLF